MSDYPKGECLGVYDRRMDKQMTENEIDWAIFGRGHWSLEFPTEEGDYPTKTSLGYQSSNIVVYLDPTSKTLCAHPRGWTGYWWSVPQPTMPDCKR